MQKAPNKFFILSFYSLRIQKCSTEPEIRNAYKWDELFCDLLQIQNSNTIGDQLYVTARTVRKWREGTRIPNPNITNNILRIAEKNTLILTNYKQDGKRNY